MKNLTLNQHFNNPNPITTCSLAKPNQRNVSKSSITAGMTPKEISTVVSDHIINVVKQQFKQNEK